jgi:threonine/homoserine/homoserine lactone efflux protein
MISSESYGIITMGAVLGLTAGISPGPLLALVLTQSITHGRKEGIKVALAPLITDLPIIAGAFLVFSGLAHFNIILSLISFSGGAFLIYLGYECVRTKGLNIDSTIGKPGSLLKGIAANFLNPHPYLFWITVGIPIALKAYQIGTGTVIAFFISFYSMLVGSKIIVSIITDRSKRLLTDRSYIRIIRILGLALFVFAVLFLIEGFKNLGIVH